MRRARRVTTVPNVIGMEAEAAGLTVLAADLTPYGSREYEPAPQTGIIARQDPAAGAQAAPGAPVILETASSGRGVEPATPDPTGTDALTPA
jgi:beta-lactam-binding protein with PASTA domain